MENNLKGYIEKFKANYAGETEEAKSVASYTRQTYTNATYVPWATMERLVMLQDVNCVPEVVKNEKGGLIHSESVTLEVTNAQGVLETNKVWSHYVVLKATFLGKELYEYYPITNNKSEATAFFNQRLMNDNIQRAKAKLLSRLTGIGLKLYEGKDLQFSAGKEDNSEVMKTEDKKLASKPKEEVKKKNKPVASIGKVEETADNIEAYAKEIKENFAAYKVGVERINQSLTTKFGDSHKLTDKLSEKDIVKILNDVDNAKNIITFLRGKK